MLLRGEMSDIAVNRAVESLLALFKAEGIDPQNKEACLKSISETGLPTRLTQIYLEKVLTQPSKTHGERK